MCDIRARQVEGEWKHNHNQKAKVGEQSVATAGASLKQTHNRILPSSAGGSLRTHGAWNKSNKRPHCKNIKCKPAS